MPAYSTCISTKQYPVSIVRQTYEPKIMAKAKTVKQTPKYLPKTNPARINRDESIISLTAQGKPQREIAKLTGTSQPTVSRIINDDQAQATLQRIFDMNIVAAEDIQANIISIAKTKPGDSEYITTRDILAAGKDNKETIGISSTHTPANVYIGKYYQQTNIQALAPAVVSMLGDHGYDVIDIEIPEP